MKQASPQSIFKYCSTSTAKQILFNDEILLNSPINFNDPYDTDIMFDNKDLEAASNIIINYFMDLAVMKVIEEHYHSLPFCQKIIAAPAKLSLKLNDISNRKFHEYRPTINYSRMLDIFTSLGIKNGVVGSASRLALENIMTVKKNGIIEDELSKTIIDKSKDLVISCFSKKEDSILMWAHYADNNRGLCLELENEDFLEMYYSSEKSSMKIKKLMYKILWHYHMGSKFEIVKSDQSEYLLAIAPFLTKADDWKYEQEVRCIFNKNNIKVLKKDDKYFYKMKAIKSITFGCRTPNDEKNEITKIALEKGIKTYETILSKESYRLVKIPLQSHEHSQ